MENIINYFETIPSLHRSLSLVGGLTFFWLLEAGFPLFKFDYKKWKHAWPNLFFTLTTIIINFTLAFLLLGSADWVKANDFGIINWLPQMPLWLYALLGVFLLDFFGAYLAHCVEHKVKPLWMVHLVHHTDHKVDTTTANRHHPVESLIRFAFTLLGVFVVGTPIALVMLYQAMSLVFTQFTHANIKLPKGLDKALSYFIISPDMHKTHHHYRLPYTDSNYGNIFSVWDRVFGTYMYLDRDKLVYGVDVFPDEVKNSDIKHLLKQPFLPILNINTIWFLILLCMSCNNEVKKIDIQGHRGCRGLLPENSLPAFEKAIDLGVNTLELDIVISKDYKVVVSHEPFMNPVICLDVKGSVIPDSLETHYNLYKMNYNEIKQFDCGSKIHPTYLNQEKIKTYKPLLSEVFDLVKAKNSDVLFNIEIKSEREYYNIFTPLPKAYVALVLDELKKNDMMSRVNLQSFDLAILEEIKKQAPNMEVALLVEDNEDIEEKLLALSYQPEIISPYFKLLNETSVKQYQEEGYKIIPWTVNEVKDMDEVKSWNVDGIITDYPNRLIEILK